MKKIIICFDVDGTLIQNYPPISLEPNKRIVELLKILSSFKNIKIVVWSGRGEEWARFITKELGLEKYVNGYASKNHKGKINGKHKFEPDIIPDIAIDDCHSCDLGLLNLIVHEKGEWHGKK